MKKNRKIILDTETTGMNSNGKIYLNHKIIEIGAVEIINRKITKNYFHTYLNPNRKVDNSAFKIHGISDNFLKDKPKFSDIYIKFLKYLKDSEIIIHNAFFDVSFINYEISLIKKNFINFSKIFKITDTLRMARVLFPGKKNSLDALIKRYKIVSNRSLHGALLDANLLAKVYLLMTSGQKNIFFKDNLNYTRIKKNNLKKNKKNKGILLKSSKKENIIHKKYLNILKNNFIKS